MFTILRVGLGLIGLRTTGLEYLQVKRHKGILSWTSLPKSKSSSLLSREHKPLGVKRSQKSLYSGHRLSLCLLFQPHTIFCIKPQTLPSVILEPRTSISLSLKNKFPKFSQGKPVVITWLYHIRKEKL